MLGREKEVNEHQLSTFLLVEPVLNGSRHSRVVGIHRKPTVRAPYRFVTA